MEHSASLITVQSCRIVRNGEPAVAAFSWTMKPGRTWLVTGPNGGGKAHFIAALAGSSGAAFEPVGEGALYANIFKNDTAVVSLETAAALIAEERANDDGDYIEGGVDIGRTARRYISEVYDGGSSLEALSEIALCGVQPVLDRGLKYLSTGEIRRVLLCRALLSGKKLLILSDPFAGLDAASRTVLRNFFSGALAASAEPSPQTRPTLLLCMERYREIPDGVSDVIEFSGGAVGYCGDRAGYEAELALREREESSAAAAEKSAVAERFCELKNERALFGTSAPSAPSATSAASPPSADKPQLVAVQLSASAPSASVREIERTELVRMRNVTVGWDGRIVLDALDWTLYAGEHWLIRGPNGSGKTTFLELITGDNMQVFSNDVSLFGRRRGTGETLWELKEKMGIVSYRLHLEYRMVGGTDLEAVLLSGLHDSIGLYEQRSQVEQLSVRKWLALGGFAGREREPFNSLSYGEQRAVLILRAAVKCPPLLILDEPCHGLDETHRARILGLLESVAETGTSTLLHVTHDPAEALPCEKHILELRPGETPMYRIIEPETV